MVTVKSCHIMYPVIENFDLSYSRPTTLFLVSIVLLHLFGFSASDRGEGTSAVYRELSPADFFTFTIPFTMKGSTDVSLTERF